MSNGSRQRFRTTISLDEKSHRVLQLLRCSRDFNLSEIVRSAILREYHLRDEREEPPKAAENVIPIGNGSPQFQTLDQDTQEVLHDIFLRWDSGEVLHPDDLSVLDFRVDMGFERTRYTFHAVRGDLSLVVGPGGWADDFAHLHNPSAADMKRNGYFQKEGAWFQRQGSRIVAMDPPVIP